jgi:hypothetical protein
LRREGRTASAEPVCSCALFYLPFARETAGAARTRSSPRPLLRVALRPLIVEGKRICKTRANAVARMRTYVQNVARMSGAICGTLSQQQSRMSLRSSGLRAADYQRHCEERLRRGNPARPSLLWIASLALAMTMLDVVADCQASSSGLMRNCAPGLGHGSPTSEAGLAGSAKAMSQRVDR